VKQYANYETLAYDPDIDVVYAVKNKTHVL
jgi:hypothetical protein